MAQPYIGEIRLFAGNFPPAGWLFCDGQLLSISQNETLFQLIGTTYGGDGQSTFALPDMRGRIPVHQGAHSSGPSFVIAQAGGVEQVTLTTQQLPAHSHPLVATSDVAIQRAPEAAIPAQTLTFDLYQSSPPNTAMASQSIAAGGGSQPHNNLQPYICLNYIISLFGIFPSQT